jgi:hypothetical protein
VPEDFSGWSRAQELYERGVELEDNGELEAALEHYEKAIAEDPAFADAYVEMAYIQLRLGDERRAVENLRKAIRVAGHPLAYYNLGWIYEGRQRPERAEILYRKALEGNPDMADAHLGLAAILLGRGAIAEARSHVDRAAQLEADADYIRFLRDSALPRYAEFAAELSAAGSGGAALGMKERVYLDFGALLLGSSGDDGLKVPAVTRRRFTRPAELAVTVGRFLEFCRHFRWRFDAAAAVEPESEPLARLLAGALGVPYCRPGEVPENRRILLVALGLGDAREYFAALDSLEESSCSAFAFVLALSPDCFREIDYRSLPQAVGLITDAEPYWLRPERGQAGPPPAPARERQAPEDPEKILARLAADVQAKWKPEPNGTEQLDWYDLAHSHLNFPLRASGNVRR